jgi:hypothetical protein
MRVIKAIFGLSLVAGLLGSATSAYAQEAHDRYMELLRSDIRAQKVEVMTEALQLTGEQAEVFWPIHREYEAELAEINDERIALVKEYFEKYDTEMTVRRVKELAERTIKLEEERTKLRKNYFKKFEKELNAMVAAKFLWTERMLNNIGDLQLQTNAPFLK